MMMMRRRRRKRKRKRKRKRRVFLRNRPPIAPVSKKASPLPPALPSLFLFPLLFLRRYQPSHFLHLICVHRVRQVVVAV